MFILLSYLIHHIIHHIIIINPIRKTLPLGKYAPHGKTFLIEQQDEFLPGAKFGKTFLL